MTTSPLFSILIAQYNNARFLRQAIDSVYAQEYVNWKIIIVDDCSTDSSHEVYKEYEPDNRIHIFYNNENKGEGYTKKRCVELSHGAICGFLDPDDVLLPNAIRDVVVVQDGKMGCIGVLDKVGVNIPCKYDMMGHFNEKGYTAAFLGGKWGVIDIHDNVVEPFVYDRAYNPGYKSAVGLEHNSSCCIVQI